MDKRYAWFFAYAILISIMFTDGEIEEKGIKLFAAFSLFVMSVYWVFHLLTLLFSKIAMYIHTYNEKKRKKLAKLLCTPSYVNQEIERLNTIKAHKLTPPLVTVFDITDILFDVYVKGMMPHIINGCICRQVGDGIDSDINTEDDIIIVYNDTNHLVNLKVSNGRIVFRFSPSISFDFFIELCNNYLKNNK